MLSLPIIFREVTVAARKKRTFLMRFVFGGLLAGVALMFVFIHVLGMSPQALGRRLLASLAWEMFVLVFMIGPALTCGCISDEQKDGTLPLLFLTHLNAADVVLGKFLSKAFDALMLFLAATPFLFVPILLGGVDYNLIFSTVFTILAMLLLGLVVGVFCSTFAGNTAASFAWAYCGLTVYCVALLALPKLAQMPIPFVKGAVFTMPEWLRLGSPLNGLFGNGAQGVREAGLTLLWCGIAGVVLLGVAVWRIPRLTSGVAGGGIALERWWGRRFTSIRKIRRPNRRLLETSPVFWLNFSHSPAHWLSQAVLGLALLGVFWASGFAGGWTMLTGWLMWFCIKLLIVIHVARSFAAEKEDGSMETLLTTPLTNRQVVRGKLRSVLARYVILCTAAIGLMVEGGLKMGAGVAVLFVLFLVASELACVVCLGLLISAWARTINQAVVLSIAMTVFVSTFMKFGFVVCSCMSLLAEPVIALVTYLILESNLRQFAARQ